MYRPLISLKPRSSKEFCFQSSFVVRLVLLVSFFGFLYWRNQPYQGVFKENDVGAHDDAEEVPVGPEIPVGPFSPALTLSPAQIKLANELLGPEKAKEIFSSQSKFEDFLYDDNTGFADKITSANPEWIEFPDLMDGSGHPHPSIIANNINLASYSGASSPQSMVQKSPQSPGTSGKKTPKSPQTQKIDKATAAQSMNSSPQKPSGDRHITRLP